MPVPNIKQTMCRPLCQDARGMEAQLDGMLQPERELRAWKRARCNGWCSEGKWGRHLRSKSKEIQEMGMQRGLAQFGEKNGYEKKPYAI